MSQVCGLSTKVISPLPLQEPGLPAMAISGMPSAARRVFTP
jgi:hypothetical protein